MDDGKKDFSIMLFPSIEEKPIQLRISQTFLRFLFVGLLIVISTTFIFINNFFEYSRQAETYELLLAENKELSEKVLEFAEMTSELNETINNMELVDGSIRVMLENQDININEEEIARQLALNTANVQTDNTEMAARGGVETQIEMGASYVRGASASVLSSRNVLGRTINELQSDLGNLSQAAKAQSESFEELEKNVKNYTKVLEATPNIWPAIGPITSSFGYRSSPFGGRYSFHEGIDIGIDYNTKIYATASGKVVHRGYSYSYGYHVVLDHGEGFTTLYAHLNKFATNLNDEVSRGDLIAYSGSSGRSTGPHLHYEVRINGERQNPKEYLPKK